MNSNQFSEYIVIGTLETKKKHLHFYVTYVIERISTYNLLK